MTDEEDRCNYKVAYASEYEANRAAHKTAKRCGGVISSYRCETHDCWHIGHPPMSRSLG